MQETLSTIKKRNLSGSFIVQLYRFISTNQTAYHTFFSSASHINISLLIENHPEIYWFGAPFVIIAN